MTFQRFKKSYKSQCLDVFDSNLGKYFAQSEREEYSEYLNSIGNDNCYYVYLYGGKLLACGGYAINQSFASLTWGMVLRENHGQELGSMLTDFRLSLIRQASSVEVVKIQTSQHTSGFYAKRGFKEINFSVDGFGKGIDCVEMELTIIR